MRFLFVVILLVGFIPVQAQVSLDLKKCREMALENSKKIAIAAQQVEKSTYDVKSYRANFFPKFSATGMYAYMQKRWKFKINGGYLPTYIQDGQGNLVPNLYLDPTTHLPVMGKDGMFLFNEYAFMPDINLALGLRGIYTAGILLEQPLFMGGKVRSAFRMAKIGKEMADLNQEYNRKEVILEADEAYWQYLKVCELVTSAEKYKSVVKELVLNLVNAYEIGMSSRNDLLKAQVKLNEAELMLQKAMNGKSLARMNLCRIVGIDFYSEVQISDTLQEGITPGLFEVKAEITGRPEYNLLEKEVELKIKEVELTRSDFLPQLGVSASYGYSDGITLNGQGSGISSFTAMASLKIPIYNWGEGRNKVRSVKAEKEMSRLRQEDMAQMMQLEIARARFNVEDAVTRVTLTRQSLSQAEENLTVSKNQYEVGMETLTDYMEAQAQWQKAWSDWIDAKAELRLSETRYLKATGQL